MQMTVFCLLLVVLVEAAQDFMARHKQVHLVSQDKETLVVLVFLMALLLAIKLVLAGEAQEPLGFQLHQQLQATVVRVLLLQFLDQLLLMLEVVVVVKEPLVVLLVQVA
jgi:hypothetical protein